MWQGTKSTSAKKRVVGITSSRGGIADTGAVVLWPTPEEPRLMSLVPPVHVAVLHADSYRYANSLGGTIVLHGFLDSLGREDRHIGIGEINQDFITDGFYQVATVAA